MDKTVPPGAALLLAFIYRTETSREPPECYEVIYGHNQNKLAKPLTKMTLDEVAAAQASWSRKFGSSATGAAQFMKATLKGLREELGVRGSQILDGNLQDRLAYHLLKRRGYDAFMSGQISATEFGKRLAQEWASFPVLAPTKGAHRDLVRGQSYYAGDGQNKALVAAERVEAILVQVKTAVAVPPILTPTPKPIPIVVPADTKDKPGPNWAAIIIVVLGLAAAGLFFITKVRF